MDFPIVTEHEVTAMRSAVHDRDVGPGEAEAADRTAADLGLTRASIIQGGHDRSGEVEGLQVTVTSMVRKPTGVPA